MLILFEGYHAGVLILNIPCFHMPQGHKHDSVRVEVPGETSVVAPVDLPLWCTTMAHVATKVVEIQ